MLICPQTTHNEAFQLAQKLRVEIENHTFEEVNHLTISIGLSQYQENQTSNELIKNTDDALYRAKEKGRNRVEIG